MERSKSNAKDLGKRSGALYADKLFIHHFRQNGIIHPN